VAVVLGVDVGAFASWANDVPAANMSAVPMASATELFM